MVLAYLIIKQKWSPDFLLAEGLLHLISLVIFGYITKSHSLKIYAGERIQTAGYLHTLIGFSVAIGLVASGGQTTINNLNFLTIDNIQGLLSPMSSGLWTSILGWLFGSEISAKGNQLAEKVETEKSLNGKSTESNTIPEFKTIYPPQNNQKESVKLDTNQNQLLEEKLDNLLSKIDQYNDALIETFRKLSLKIDAESDVFIQTFRKLSSKMNTESEDLIKTYRQLSSKMDTESEDLFKTFRKLSSDIENHSNSFPKALDNFSLVIQENSRSLSRDFEHLREATRNTANKLGNI